MARVKAGLVPDRGVALAVVRVRVRARARDPIAAGRALSERRRLAIAAVRGATVAAWVGRAVRVDRAARAARAVTAAEAARARLAVSAVARVVLLAVDDVAGRAELGPDGRIAASALYSTG